MNKGQIISKTLKELGISPGILGYSYLREAILLAMDDESIVHSMTKRLYPSVARKFDSTSSRVERGMRYAIESGWSNGDYAVQFKIFGYTVSNYKGKPTNSAFIATVVDYFKNNSKE